MIRADTTTLTTVGAVNEVVDAGRFTVSQNNHISLLNFVTLLKVRNNSSQRNSSLMKRSARQTVTRRTRETSATPRVTSNKTPEVFKLCFKVFAVASIAADKIQQIEVRVNLNLTHYFLLMLRRFSASLIVVIIRFMIPVVITKRKNVKRNLDFLTKPSKVEKLLSSILKDATHRPRPVKDKNQTVIFTVRHHIDFLEYIFIPLVSMEFLSIKNTSLGSAGTSILVGRLTHFKLFHKVVNLTLSFATKLQIVTIGFGKQFRRLWTEAFLTILHHSFIVNHDRLYTQLRNLNVVERLIATILVYQLFLVFSECLVSLGL